MSNYMPFDTRETYTKFDNLLLDYVMPPMPPSTWKILCLIVRRTRGFHKDAEELSYREIMEGSGVKSSATVSKSLLLLHLCEFIVVEGEEFSKSTIHLNTTLEIEAASKNEVGTALKIKVESSLKNEEYIKRNSSSLKKVKDSPASQGEPEPEPTKPQLKDHPAVKAYREVFHRSMKRTQYPHVQHIDDIDKWTAVLTEWLLRSYNPTNLSGQLDWYRKGIPKSYKRKQANAQQWDTSRQDHPGWRKDWSGVVVQEDYDHESINF